MRFDSNKRARGVALVLTMLAVVLGLGGALEGAANAKQKLAVLGLEPDDASSAKVALWATEGLRNRAVGASARYELPATGKRDLAELKLVSDCIDEKIDCMVQIGKDLGVERLLWGKIQRKGSGFVLTLKLLDVSSKKFEKGAYQKDIPAADATEDGVKKVASTAFGELTGVTNVGSIEIQANVDSGTVYVDGATRGVIAQRAASISEVAEGTYTVEIVAAGKKKWSKPVAVRAGQPTVVVAELEAEGGGAVGDNSIVPPNPPPGGDDGGAMRPGRGWRIAFWTSLAFTAGGAAAFTITGSKVRSLEDDKIAAIVAAGPAFQASPDEDACAKANVQRYAPVQSVCSDGKKYATMTNVFVGVTIVAAVAAGFFYYKGYIAAPKAPPKDVKRKRNRGVADAGEIFFTPQLSPTSAGLGAVITF